MVRLKVPVSLSRNCITSYFNSTMVRLKVRCTACLFVRGFYFNSTMVRLKGTTRAGRLAYTKFQFHYGTIKSNGNLRIRLPLTYFNSTMVRLKDEKGYIFVTLTIKFQFHYGTIKSNKSASTSAKFWLFQFHYGTIKRLAIHLGAISFLLISIPLWYD